MRTAQGAQASPSPHESILTLSLLSGHRSSFTLSRSRSRARLRATFMRDLSSQTESDFAFGSDTAGCGIMLVGSGTKHSDARAGDFQLVLVSGADTLCVDSQNVDRHVVTGPLRFAQHIACMVTTFCGALRAPFFLHGRPASRPSHLILEFTSCLMPFPLQAHIGIYSALITVTWLISREQSYTFFVTADIGWLREPHRCAIIGRSVMSCPRPSSITSSTTSLSIS